MTTASKSTLKIRSDYRMFPYWTINEAAEFAGVTRRTIFDWLNLNPKLNGFARGPYRIDGNEFIRWMKIK